MAAPLLRCGSRARPSAPLSTHVVQRGAGGKLPARLAHGVTPFKTAGSSCRQAALHFAMQRKESVVERAAKLRALLSKIGAQP